MKTLSIQQPWASLICAGIKDVENRTWKPSTVPGRILIHASSKKVTKNFLNSVPLDQMIEIKNEVLFGNIDQLEKLPTSAIIGYVTVKSFQDITDSVWDCGEGIIKWVLEDAYLFDEPIMDVKGKLNLFDYPLDENNLPAAHKVELAAPKYQDKRLSLPCNEDAIDIYKTGKQDNLSIDLGLKVLMEATTEEAELKEISELALVSPTRTLVMDVTDCGIYSECNHDTDEPIQELNCFGEMFEWECLAFVLTNPRLE